MLELWGKSMTLTGVVLSADPDAARFNIRCRSGDEIGVKVTRETVFGKVANLDELDHHHVSRPPDSTPLTRGSL